MAIEKIDNFDSVYRAYPTGKISDPSPVVESTLSSKVPIGLAGVPDSISTCKEAPSSRTLFAPPKVPDYMCIEFVDGFSETVRDIVDVMSQALSSSHDQLKLFKEEKLELLKDFIAKSQDASNAAYYQNMGSYALAAFNFALGAFLMDSSAAEAAVPAMCFMAAAGLSAAGLVMKESSGWHFIAKLCAGENADLEEKIKTYAPLALLGLSSAITLSAGSLTALNSSAFSGLTVSKETALNLEKGIAASTSFSTAAGAVTKSREGFARAGLADIQDKISSGSHVQEGLTTFVSTIKGLLDTCYGTLKQIIQNSINRSVA